MAQLIGKQLGQYVITAQIGKGGMATVYRAHHAAMDRDVAIKVMDDEIARQPEFIARFEREAKLIARLQHPHILPVYDYARTDEITYLVMRLVEGQSLDKLLRASKLPLELVVRFFDQVADALAYAHKNGVIHRDLKPNNILLDESNNAYLTDFGIAKMIESHTNLTAAGLVMGTPSYMAPELWRGEPPDTRVDIYALGIMLYEMLTGEVPFTADTPYALMSKHIDTPLPSSVLKRPEVPPTIDTAIKTATAKTAANRYTSVADFANAVDSGYASTQPHGRPVIPPPPTPIHVDEPTIRETPMATPSIDARMVSAPISGGTLPGQPGFVPAQPKGAPGRLPYALLAVIVLAVVIAAGAFLLRGQPAPGASVASQTSAAVSNITPTVAVAVVATTPAPTQTSLPVIAATTAAPGLTNTPVIVSTTAVPTTVAATTAGPTTVAQSSSPLPATITPTSAPVIFAIIATSTPIPPTAAAPTFTSLPPTVSVPSVRLEVFRDGDTLTLYLPDAKKVSLANLTFQTLNPQGKLSSALLKNYPSFIGLPFDSVGGPLCFQIGQRTRTTPLPLECRQIPSSAVFIERLSPANLFWFDNVANAPLTISFLLGEQSLGQCPANALQCEFFIPLDQS